MAKLVLTNASVTLAGTDLSSYVEEVTLGTTTDAVECSTMGSTWRTFLPGPDSWELSLTFFQDYAANQVEDTLETIFAGRASVTAVILPTSSPAAVGNPSFTGSVILTDRPVVSGTWGDASQVSVTLQGSGALTRAES